jgi:hypothetical protein
MSASPTCAPALRHVISKLVGDLAMPNPTKLIDTMQVEWPLLPSLALVGIVDMPPPWVAASAQRIVARLQPHEIAACRAQVPRQIQFLGTLHQRWAVTSVLAVLLALAVVARALATPPSSVQMGVLISVMSAILLPPLVICNGIARDYVAARALASALNGPVQPPR